VIRLLPIGFLLLPLIEIALFIVVGRAIGVLPTLALIVLAAVGGMLLLRQQGRGVVARMRSNMSMGTIPGREVFDTMLIGLAAFMLLIPGFLTDIVALALLVPAVRGWIFSALARRVRVVDTTTSYRRYGANDDARLNRPPTIDLDDEDWRNGRS
jgi:UPF0716 protein FxsA